MRDRLAAARTFWDYVQKVRSGREARDATAGTVPTEVAAALAELDRIRDACRALVTRRASLSAGASIIPLPLVDVGTDITILTRLLPQISERFGLSKEQIDGLDIETKRVVMLFVSGVGSTLIGRMITRGLVVRVLRSIGVRVTAKGVVKFVPLLGQAISASISFGAMKLLGDQHIDDCYRVARGALLQDAGAPLPAKWEVVR